jgi:hypothetical protein
MNAGTGWGKKTIGPRGWSVEKAPGSDFYFMYNKTTAIIVSLGTDRVYLDSFFLESEGITSISLGAI